VRFDVVVVGGGTAGCVLAARLSENADRTVCLLEAGPDYGSLAEGRWPAEILDARQLPTTHDWQPAPGDIRTLGGRLLGGSSAINACMVVMGAAADYDEWGAAWSLESLQPYVDRARSALRVAGTYTNRPAPFHVAFEESARAAGFPMLGDADDPERPVGIARSPANVVEGRRWNAALAYLDPARERANLAILADTLVDRVVFDGRRAVGVRTADGRVVEAGTVVLAAGAYFSPAVLMRSGVGPEAELRRHRIAAVEVLPVGDRLLDHHGIGMSWQPSERLQAETAAHEAKAGLFAPHLVLKAASKACAKGLWDLHAVSWVGRGADTGRYETSAVLFNMKPLSTGSVRLRSADPGDLPAVERGLLARSEDVLVLLDAIEIVRSVAAADPLRSLVGDELTPGAASAEAHVRENVQTYYHPAGTCPLGTVLDERGHVLGVDGLVVGDASVMPTIPRANTNLTTAAVAEKIAAGFV
jgi:choline dehydrogenase